MASYFDLPPQGKAPAASIEQVPEDQRKQLGRMSLMSPAVIQILEGLGDEDSDSNSDEEHQPPIEEGLSSAQHPKKDPYTDKARQEKQKHTAYQPPRPSSLSPSRSSFKNSTTKGPRNNKASPASTTGDSSVKPKHTQPQMARFHSLRSMLFQANIQDRMKTVTQEDSQKEKDAATKWRDQHQERQMHPAKWPEKDAQSKAGIGGRIRMAMRRMTTKDAGSMEKIREDGAPVEFNHNSSTAPADNDDVEQHASNDHPDSDNESMNYSDVEDLVRWMSQRDPASDGEARKCGRLEMKEDSGHESLGDSDVDDLVRHVSRQSDVKEENDEKDQHTVYSDASTESDSDLHQDSSDDEEDAEELVRWVSRHQGPKAGPIRRNLERPELDSDVEKHYDSDVPELGRWFKRYDGTSGESAASTPVKETFDLEEEERGRARSRECERPVMEKRHMTHEDVEELVRWVSKKGIKREATLISSNEDPEKGLTTQEENNQEIGMSTGAESSSHLDVANHIEHARKISGDKTTKPAPPAGVEVGDLKAFRNEKAETKPEDPQRELQEKKEELGMTLDEGSLSHSDVQGLVAHVQKL
jgi:hypothetical protein